MAKGREGEVMVHDPEDADLTYKVQFEDGTTDWFKKWDVVVPGEGAVMFKKVLEDFVGTPNTPQRQAPQIIEGAKILRGADMQMLIDENGIECLVAAMKPNSCNIELLRACMELFKLMLESPASEEVLKARSQRFADNDGLDVSKDAFETYPDELGALSQEISQWVGARIDMWAFIAKKNPPPSF